MTTEYESTNGGWYQINQAGDRARRRICGDCRKPLAECACPKQASAQQRKQVAR